MTVSQLLQTHLQHRPDAELQAESRMALADAYASVANFTKAIEVRFGREEDVADIRSGASGRHGEEVPAAAGGGDNSCEFAAVRDEDPPGVGEATAEPGEDDR